MVAISTETRSQARTKPQKSRNTFHALVRIDRRLALGKRVEALVGILRARVADPDDPLVAAAIDRCAETIALSEELRARMLRGDETVSANDVVRTTRAADGLTRGLCLARQPTQAAPSLADYVAAKYARGEDA